MEFSMTLPELLWPDLLGLAGVALIVLAYALLQSDTWRQQDRIYSLANAIGAALILVSLAFDFNLSAAAMELCWLVISLYGLWRHWNTQGNSHDKGNPA
jgi:hypothetical protein